MEILKFKKNEAEPAMFSMVLISYILYSSLSPLSLSILIHESGHALFCYLQGGSIAEVFISHKEGYVTCSANFDNFQLFLFLVSGMFVELIFALFFLSIPKFRVIGGVFMVLIAAQFIGGSYASDINQILEIVPSLSFVNSLIFKATVLLMGLLCFFLSAIQSYHEIRENGY
ncbi:MAG TPA: hypothetical protein ENF49_00245 [Candidatus Altiarchaeales archaeon]|nr:hypothetical protein [Candidatus Altiarchaeales archaeon]HEX54548.1 hypothetical protein [Candidatus Altiarchaeales archaeon]